MCRCGELGHVDPDFTDDDFSDAFGDVRDRVELVPGISERDHQLVDLAIDAVHGLIEVVDVIEQLSAHHRVETG